MAYIGKNPKWNTATFTPQSSDPANPVEGMVFRSDGTPRAEGLWQYINSNWERIDSILKTLTSVSATTTISNADDVILADSSGGVFTINLPTASGISGKVYEIKKESSDLNEITIDADGSETIEGNPTTTINTIGEVLTIVSDGSNWIITDRKTQTDWIDFTPTGTWSTNTTYVGKYRRIGTNIQIQYSITTTGAPTAGALQLDPPANISVDESNLLQDVNRSAPQGNGFVLDNGVSRFPCTSLYDFSNNTFDITVHDCSSVITRNSSVTNTTPMTFANGDEVIITLTVPVDGWNS